ncbi:MAG: S41 family peptidase [Gemmataceae bacterium]
MTTSLAWLLVLLVRATLWLALVCLAACAFHRAAAARRHLVWTAGLIGLLLLPFVSLALPHWGVVSPVTLAPTPPHVPAVALASDDLPAWLFPTPLEVKQTIPPVPPPPADAPVQAAAPALDPAPGPAVTLPALSTVLVAVWLAGVLLFLAWITLGVLMLHRLGRRAAPVSDGPLADACEDLAADLGLAPAPLLLRSRERAIPMTWGLVRAKILLPHDALQWSQQRLRLVLLHELGHVRRRDCLTQFLGLLARALFWFHPLVWFAARRQRAEQEHACDDLVLSRGADAPDYAAHLLEISARLPASHIASLVAPATAQGKTLERRLRALLDTKQKRRPWSRFGRAAFVTLSLGALALAATLELLSSPASARPTVPWLPPPGEKEPAADAKAGDKKDKADKAPDIDIEAVWQEVRKKLKESYVGPLDDRKLAEAMLRGMLDALKDPYTDYLPPMDLKTMEATMRGAFAGVGAQLKADGDRIVVVTPIENSPALRAGLRPGDILHSVDGETVRGAPLAKVVHKILGPKGSTVKLRVQRADGAVEDLNITRDIVRVGSVEGFHRDAAGAWVHWLDRDRKIGYAQITQFLPGTAKQLHGVLDQLKKDGLKGLVLDLRGCPGGMLDQAVACVKLFLDKGKIVSIKGSGKDEKTFEADGAPFADLPLVILVDEHTASAAEILAGALRDHGRAILVGGRTVGKGSIQTIVSLEAGGALKVTSAYYFLPSGRNIQKRPGVKTWGVEPTDGFYVLLTPAQHEKQWEDRRRRSLLGFKKGEAPKYPERFTPALLDKDHADPSLAAALKTMTAKLTGGEFTPVGKKAADVEEQILKLDELRERREALLKNLKSVDEEIQGLQKAK